MRKKANQQPFTVSETFRHAAGILENTNRPVFITGCAGTGKSTLLRQICRHSRKNPVILAPTGIAALLAGGQTIHRFFRFKTKIKPEEAGRSAGSQRRRLYKKLRLLVIDEVSMLRADLLDCIDIFLRRNGPHADQPFGGVQIALFGDLGQLPPVIPPAERDMFHRLYRSPYFFSSQAISHLEMAVVELTTIYRQEDKTFIDLLSRIRDGKTTDDDLRRLNTRYQPDMAADGNAVVTLTATNRVANALNERYMRDLPGNSREFEAEMTGEFPDSAAPTAKQLKLKKGALVMLLNNDRDGRWVNGSTGTIEGRQHHEEHGEQLVVRLTQTKQRVFIPKHTWPLYRYTLKGDEFVTEEAGSFRQYPMRLAWAITIHKSQGQTYDRMILDAGSGLFDHGQAYVALSRCRTLNGIYLKRPLNARDILTDPGVGEQMDAWRKQQAVADFIRWTKKKK